MCRPGESRPSTISPKKGILDFGPPPLATQQLKFACPPSHQKVARDNEVDDMESSLPDPHEAWSQEYDLLQVQAAPDAVVEAPRPGSPVSEESAELYFLIANFLTNASPCSRAAAVLQQELVRVETRSKLVGSVEIFLRPSRAVGVF